MTSNDKKIRSPNVNSVINIIYNTVLMSFFIVVTKIPQSLLKTTEISDIKTHKTSRNFPCDMSRTVKRESIAVTGKSVLVSSHGATQLSSGMS